MQMDKNDLVLLFNIEPKQQRETVVLFLNISF
jgi:hypothetical protein